MKPSAPHQRLAKALVASLDVETAAGLAENPVPIIEAFGIRVDQFPSVPGAEECSCEGIYHRGPPPSIGYVPVSPRRTTFTLLHEFGHYLCSQDYDVLSDLADMDDCGGREAEELVCHGFAGEILVTEEAVAALLGGRQPIAGDVTKLYDESNASLEVCAIRLTPRLRSFGYIVVANPNDQTISIAMPSATNDYPWRTGTVLPQSHPIWCAARDGTYRGEGDVVWPSGQRKSLWLDAATKGSRIVAVMVEERHWTSPELNIPSAPGARPALEPGEGGTCWNCGRDKWGSTMHDPCGEVWCRACEKCGCGAPAALAKRRCDVCFLSKPSSQFEQGMGICIDCN